MSSFGSSLINKGKKVVPKAAGRRRPGGAASALSINDAASETSRPSLEPSQTPQPEPARVSVPPVGLPTPEATQVTQIPQVPQAFKVPAIAPGESDGVPAIHFTAPARDTTSQPQAPRSHEIPARAETSDIPSVTATGSPASAATSGRRRSASPHVEATKGAKRQRLDDSEQPTSRTTPNPPVNLPVVPSRPVQPRNDDEIPVIQVNQSPPAKTLSRPSKAVQAAKQTRTAQNGIVDYETPEQTQAQPSSATSASAPAPRRRASRPAVAPLLTTTIQGAKPRAKGTRRNQWQISTPTDLAAVRARDYGYDLSPQPVQEGEEEGSTAPRLRKVRKDKGVRKGPIRMDLEDGGEEEDVAQDLNGSTRNRPSRAELASAAKHGRAIAPQPSGASQQHGQDTNEGEDGEGADAEGEAPGPTSEASARLRNAQKRRAKQVAAQNARSRANGKSTAVAIDQAIAQSVEGPASRRKSSAANPFDRLQAQEDPRSQRSSSVTTDSTEVSVVSEGGTKQKKRYKRQATPPGNETVFIAEKVTPMISLSGRDTENRVGQRSITEMRMRNVDWKQVKAGHEKEENEMAILKGNRKTNHFETIRQQAGLPPRDATSNTGTPASGEGEGEEAEEDEDGGEMGELEKAIKQRERIHGPTIVGKAILVNGAHRLDEESRNVMTQAEVIEAQTKDGLPAEENDLIKRRFTVHSLIKWKRKDPKERIYKPSRWTDDETELFYDALRCCGVDFMSMARWFPTRIRKSLKRKFNMEEKHNKERIDEVLNAHMMMRGHEDGGIGWDMEQFKANGASLNLMDPKAIYKELEKTRVEREVEIAEAREEYKKEKQNKRNAGVEPSDDEEDEEGDEEEEEVVGSDVEAGSEVDEEPPSPGDMIANIQKGLIEKKRRTQQAEAGAEKGDKQTEIIEDADEQGDDDDIVPTMEGEDGEGLYAPEDEEPADWDDMEEEP